MECLRIMNKKCIGCGCLLQVEDSSKRGYIKASLINNEWAYCERCFKLKNYQINPHEAKTEDDYLSVVSSIQNTNSLVVMVVDIFDFSGTFVSSIKRHTGQNDIILVGNKFDLIPKSVKENKVTKFMRHMANLEGFRVLDAVLVSSKTGYNLDKLMDSIDKNCKGRDTYFVGCSNVGKSSLLNAIIRKYSDVKKDVITTSTILGTTLDLIKIPYDDYFLVDTPGLINNHSALSYLDEKSIACVMPKKEIKPLVLQLNSDQSVMIGGLASFSYVFGEKNNFVFYFSNDLYIHRTKTINLERLIETQYNKLLIPVFGDTLYSDFTQSEFNIKDDNKKYDIVISGLGFICIKGNARVIIKTLKGVSVYLREAII